MANGRIIIEDAVDLCNYVAKHPTQEKWFDNSGASGNTDDRISSDHAVDYDEVKPLTVIQEISQKATNPAGQIGFDVYETAEGTLIGHLKGSSDFVCPITPILRNAVKGDDLHPVRNRIKVYGAANKRLPSDSDQWTEQSAATWTADYGTLMDLQAAKVGTWQIVAVFDSATKKVQFHRDISAHKFGYGKGSFKTIHFYWKYSTTGGNMITEEVRLMCDASNYFYATLKHNDLDFFSGQPRGWQEENITLGASNEFDPLKDVDDEGNPVYVGKWRKVGSPTWIGIRGLAFYAQTEGHRLDFNLDGLYFDGAECSGEAEDTASQAIYGVRVAEPISDTTLLTDDECLLKAKSLLAQLKSPELTLKEVVVDGDHRYRQGDKVTLLGKNWRITQVKHQVKNATWDTVLTVEAII